jgi:DNA-binding GntR family transcriptional regulator
MPAMEMIPERRSLVAQAVEILRASIKDGEWERHLPTEAQLRERMQVGRNTVRAALAVLEKEGWITPGRPGRRREVLRRRRGVRPGREPPGRLRCWRRMRWSGRAHR